MLKSKIFFTFIIFSIGLVILNFFLMFSGELYGPLYDALIKPGNFFINQRIEGGLYPFFFNSLNGIDIIGESQFSALFPTKLILYFFNFDVDTEYKILIISYLLIGVLGIYYLFSKKNERNYLYETLFIIIFLSLTFFRANLPHQFFIGAFTIFFSLNIIYILKLSNKINNKKFIFLGSLTVALLILVGNFTLQWLFLTVLSMSILLLKLKKKDTEFFTLISPMFFGCGIASVQIFLTADLMMLGDRSVNILDFSKFNNFASPYIFSGFFNLISTVSMQSFNNNTLSGFEITDNAIFLGLFPLIIVISDIYISKSKIFDNNVKFFLITMMVIVSLRSLGGFFLPNILISSLPIFGQLRGLFRDLITLEILIFLYFIYLYFNNEFKIEKKVLFSICSLSIIIFVSFELWRFFLTNNILKITFLSLVGPILYWLSYRLFKNEDHKLLKLFFIICIIEITLVNFIYPNHLGYKKNFNEGNNCKIPLNFKPSKNYNYNSTGHIYYYDNTFYYKIFRQDPFDYRNNDKEKFGLHNGEHCPNINLLDQSTLTPTSMKYIVENHDNNPMLAKITFDLIFHHDRKFINETLDAKLIYDLRNINFKYPILNNDKTLGYFFNILKFLKIDNKFLVEKNYIPINIYDANAKKYISLVPYGNKRIIIQNISENFSYSKVQYGPINVLNGNIKKIDIYYVPVIEIISLIIMILFIFLFIIYLNIQKK
jgi:hypothetical protein